MPHDVKMQLRTATLLATLALASLWFDPLPAANAQSNPLEFDTVINSPPQPVPRSIGSSTQLNLADGGEVPFSFDAGLADGSSTNVEVNINGGSVGNGFHANPGSTVNINQGTVAIFLKSELGSVVNVRGGVVGRGVGIGGELNISGGEVGSGGSGRVVDLEPGSHLNLSGGRITDDVGGSGFSASISGGAVAGRLIAGSGASVQISGGRFGWGFNAADGSVTLHGNEFSLNGVEYTESAITLQAGDIFTGTLASGAVFIFTPTRGDNLADVQLVATDLAAAAVSPILVDGVGPDGLRPGETLNLLPGGALDGPFSAVGGVLNVDGGSIGAGLEVVETEVNLSSGTVGGRIDLFAGSVFRVSGGFADSYVYAHPGSEVHVTGGRLENIDFAPDSFGVISGGVIGPAVTVEAGASLTISGGTVEEPRGSGFRALPGSEVHLVGTQFTLDGRPIRRLDPGETQELRDRRATLAGILADGTPFEFYLGAVTSRDDYFDVNATLKVTLLAVPEPSACALLLTGSLGIGWRRR